MRLYKWYIPLRHDIQATQSMIDETAFDEKNFEFHFNILIENSIISKKGFIQKPDHWVVPSQFRSFNFFQLFPSFF